MKRLSKAEIEKRVAAMSNEELFDDRMSVNLDNVSPGLEEFEVMCIENELRRRLTEIGFLPPP